MTKRENRGVKYVYPVEWISPTNKKINISVLINGELNISTLNAHVKMAKNVSALVLRTQQEWQK